MIEDVDASEQHGELTAFVAGGTGLVGAQVVARLVAGGWRVRALARDVESEQTLRASGATPVPGDLLKPSDDWREALDGADLVVHAGLPRLSPPVRGRHVRRMARQAGEGAAALARSAAGRRLVAVSTTLVGRGLALARPAEAMEEKLEGRPGTLLVRLPWVYGQSGPMAWVSQAVAARRYRIVGPGINRWPLISAADAAAAVLAARELPDGAYTASEPEAPRQRELVEHLCATGGTPIPDHVPEPLASFSLGGPLAAALAANGAPEVSDAVAAAGWSPSHEWRRDLLELTRPPGDPAEG